MNHFAKTPTAMIKQDKWYVVYTYPNSEKKIYNELNKREITAFLPLRTEVRQWHDRKKIMEAPLFPNYVFVKVAPRDLWTALSVTGVVRYITFDGAPAVVRDSEVDLVKRMLASHATVHNEALHVNGEKVQVTQGPLAGLTGKVVHKKGLTKLYIELETVRQTLSVEIDAALLSRVQEGGAASENRFS